MDWSEWVEIVAYGVVIVLVAKNLFIWVISSWSVPEFLEIICIDIAIIGTVYFLAISLVVDVDFFIQLVAIICLSGLIDLLPFDDHFGDKIDRSIFIGVFYILRISLYLLFAVIIFIGVVFIAVNGFGVPLENFKKLPDFDYISTIFKVIKYYIS